MSSQRLLTGLLTASLLLIPARFLLAQPASSNARDAANAFPCPSGDASCGNGAPPASEKRRRHGHRKREKSVAPQNSLPDSNPNQKIEDAPPGDVDEGVQHDLDEMNREGTPHAVNRPK